MKRHGLVTIEQNPMYNSSLSLEAMEYVGVAKQLASMI